MAPHGAKNLALTILTGRRPAYLRRTVESLRHHAAIVTAAAHVTLMVNGRDPETLAYVDSLDWLDELVVLPGDGVMPIGPAVSKLYDYARRSGRPIWMHLEDDWRCLRPGWLAAGLRVLETEPAIGQVRLRSASEPVLKYHLVTRKTIKWERRRGYKMGDAHYTFNPTLVRVSDVQKVFPCTGEPDAMRKFCQTKKRVAQLLPGAFAHLGEHSLRGALGRSH